MVAGLANAAFNLGHVIAPRTFQDRNAPRYEPSKITALACQIFTVVMAVLLRVYYELCNRSRKSKQATDEEDITEEKAFAGLTDKQNLGFRYKI
jgi:hypothetical protein